VSNLFDDLSDIAKKESGGGIVCKGKIETGIKFFQSGVGNRDSFFACDLRDEKAVKTATEKAKAKLAELGNATGRVSKCVQLVAYKDCVKGRDVTWQDDRFFCYPLYTQAAKAVVLPSFKSAGVNALGELWYRIGFAPDPSGRLKKNQNGEDVVEQIAYVAEVYASEQAALAAVAGGDVKAESKAATIKVPTAFADDPQAWLTWIAEVKNNIKEMPAPKVKAYVEKNYSNPQEVGATVAEILEALKS
jgi:hypothetical protein